MKVPVLIFSWITYASLVGSELQWHGCFNLSYDNIQGALGTDSVININYNLKMTFTTGDAKACDVCFINFAGEA